MRFLFFFAFLFAIDSLGLASEPWKRHTIDASSRGADGVRLEDFNRDGLPDIVVGWEEGGIVRVYLHPGHAKVRDSWPSVTVGKAKSPEDAMATDLDGDGSLDVISFHEGSEKAIWFHWGPSLSEGDDPSKVLLNKEAWKSEVVPSTKNKSSWMYGAAMQVDGKHGVDLVVGSKSKNAMIGWLEAPKDPRDVKAWKLHPIETAGWIMSIELADVNKDGKQDIFVTDRKGSRRGMYWLKNLGDAQFQRQDIGLSDKEVMFAQLLEVGEGKNSENTATGWPEAWSATRNGEIFRFHGATNGGTWRNQAFANPMNVRSGKAIAIKAIGEDELFLVHTTNTAASGLRGKAPATAATFGKRDSDGKIVLDKWRDISGLTGTKFDRIELLDLDGDNDLDVLTCEETDNLGVFWYEQP